MKKKFSIMIDLSNTAKIMIPFNTPPDNSNSKQQRRQTMLDDFSGLILHVYTFKF